VGKGRPRNHVVDSNRTWPGSVLSAPQFKVKMFDYITIAVSLADPLTRVYLGTPSHSVTHFQIAADQTCLT
jgi:hypothetical protein